MTLLVLLIFASVIAGAVGALIWRWSRVTGPTAPSARRHRARSRRGDAAPPGRRRARQQARSAGRNRPGLTLALVVIVVGGVLLAVLAYLVRGNADLVRLDNSVANWGDRHASPFSTDGAQRHHPSRRAGRGRRAGRRRWPSRRRCARGAGGSCRSCSSSSPATASSPRPSRSSPIAYGRRSTRSPRRSGRRSRAATHLGRPRSSRRRRSCSAAAASGPRERLSPGSRPGSPSWWPAAACSSTCTG